jgi:proline dehydrogenase
MAHAKGMFEPTKKAIAEGKAYPYVFSPTFSLKPSSFLFSEGMHIPQTHLWRFEEFLNQFGMRAMNYGAGITIDMEEPYLVENTIKCYLKYAFNIINGTEIIDTRIPIFDNLSIVHQTSLDRTQNDIRKYASFPNKVRVRLCIGIYDVNKKDIWAQSDLDSKVRSIGTMNLKERKKRLVEYTKYLAERNVYVEVATHDVEVIKELQQWFKYRSISKDMYEFQALYHVKPKGLEELHRQLLDEGTRVRIYLPYAPTLDNAVAYGIRRASKNPQLLWTFTKEAVKYYMGFSRK